MQTATTRIEEPPVSTTCARLSCAPIRPMPTRRSRFTAKPVPGRYVSESPRTFRIRIPATIAIATALTTSFPATVIALWTSRAGIAIARMSASPGRSLSTPGSLLFARRGAVGKDQGIVLTDPARGDRRVGATEALEHRDLLGPCHEPEDAPGAVQDRIGQRHPAPSHVDARHGDVAVGDGENRDRPGRATPCGRRARGRGGRGRGRAASPRRLRASSSSRRQPPPDRAPPPASRGAVPGEAGRGTEGSPRGASGSGPGPRPARFARRPGRRGLRPTGRPRRRGRAASARACGLR